MWANVTPRGAAKAALICLVAAAVLRRMGRGGERSVPPELASDSANGLGYQIVLANRDPATLASEASQSCSGACRYPISGLALSPPHLWAGALATPGAVPF